MLHRLTVANFAILRDTEVHFREGFTAVTGETGAGKSLLVEAITFLAGGKVPPGVIRDGARAAVVEAEFVQGEEVLTLRREIAADGRSRAFLNDSPVSLQRLAAVSSALVDITAQRAFSHLLDPDRHLDFLDAYAGLEEERARLAKFYHDFIDLQRKISRLERDKQAFEERRALLEFQLSEIEAVNPTDGEDERLAAEIKQLEHLEDLQTHARKLEDLLVTGEGAVDGVLHQCEHLLQQISGFDAGLKPLCDELTSARAVLREVSRTVADRCRRLEFEADRLEFLRERQFRLAGLARKFGGTLAAVEEKRRAIKMQIAAGDHTGGKLNELIESRKELVKRWRQAAEDVGRRRREAARRLEESVAKSLGKLGVPEVRFEVRLERTPDPEGQFEADGSAWRLTDRGAESARMFISSNPGIQPRPVHQVASGGELSRLMLALKEAMPPKSGEPVIILDEIDTGVSGRIADLVGRKLRALSRGRQLVAVTHLPQIAARAEHHLLVAKSSTAEGAVTAVTELTGEDRVREIAALLSGGAVTQAALDQARHLLQET